ncbi:MAG: hypothetical protein IPM17_16175 [Verrucomicrobia bacterium]|nr:hypothetical protein [Verrucomicrobiota bacterium]
MKSKYSLRSAATLSAALLTVSSSPFLHAQSLEEALDSPPGWSWTTTATDGSGNPHPAGIWDGQTAITHDGVDAARSGPLPLWGRARLRTESITGPGTVTFWRRHGRASEQNPMWMTANGNSMWLFLPGGLWQPVAIDFPPGPGSLEFVWDNYDWAALDPDNHAYVDEVAFVPTTGAPQFLPDPPPNLTVGEGYTIQPPIALLGEKPMHLEMVLPGGGAPNVAILDPATASGIPVLSGWPFGFFAHPSLSGLWSITASNGLGVVTRNFNVTVLPAAPHSIWLDGPSPVWAGATLRIEAHVRGTAPFTFQWWKDGAPLAGQTAQTLNIPSFGAGDVGTYSVVVENALGSRTSEPFHVGLGSDAPVLVSQSGDVDLPTWGWTSLQVEVTGTPPFETEWRRDGVVVESNAYALNGAGSYGVGGTGFAGVYEFTSRNGLGEVTSAPIVVQEAPLGAALADALDNRTVGWRLLSNSEWRATTTETHDGVDAAALLDSSPDPLRTAVKGPAAVSFWWRVVEGALDFTVNGAVVASVSNPGGDSGWQRVEVPVGTGWHELEWLTQDWTPAAYLDEFHILAGGGGPVISSQPEGGDYFDGDTAVIAVTVTGTGPFDYRLFKDDGTTPVQDALAQAATTYEFNVPVTSGAEGAYWIEVTDSAGRSAISDDAVISSNGSFPAPVNVAEAVGQPALPGYYTGFSVADGSFYPIRPWYRTRQDGVAPGADRSARTPALNSGELAAVAVVYDAGAEPARLRFWARVTGAPFADVFFVGVNGTLETPTPAGTATGASGETWTAYDILLPPGPSDVQFELLADRDGVTAWLDRLEFVPATPPEITQQPVSLVRPAGEPGALSVVATGVGPLLYQWFKDGSALTGETNDVLTFPSLAAGDAGQYYVEVNNDFGTTPSDNVMVIVTGPRPQITQPLQPQQLAPGDNLLLAVVASSSNGPLTYRWFRNDLLVQTGGTTFQRNPANPADHGLYRVEVSDPYYTVSSQAKVTVSHVYYQLTVLPNLPGGSYARAEAINNAGVVAGYGDGGGGGTSAIVWENGVPTRLTSPGAPFNWAGSINNAGVVVGAFDIFGADAVVRWTPPYTSGVFDNLGAPPGPGTLDGFPWINDAGVITVMRLESYGVTESFGKRHAFRYTPAGVWEPFGPLSGSTPLAGATDQGWASPLDINNAGVVVGLTHFDQGGAAATQATGWIFDPAAPGGRTAMDTFGPELALTAIQPWGWADSVNDFGDIAARRWGAGGPTKLFLIHSGGAVTKLLEVPALPDEPDRDSFNVDALNNRREMVGTRSWPDPYPYNQRAMLVRSRGTPPGGTPASLNDFEIYDLNDLVPGGTGGIVLRWARGINDAGQIVGSGRWTDGRPDPDVAFLLTPVTPYAGMAARAVDDVIVRRAGQGIRFSAASLLRNDLGQAPLTLQSIATAGEEDGVITDLGGGWYHYAPPAGPDLPDRFSYVVRADDGSTSTGTVRVLVEAEPPPQNQLPIQLLPGGEVRVRFVGIPGRTYQIQAAPAVNGPWTTLATRVAGPTGLVEYQETPPPGPDRFYRMVE